MSSSLPAEERSWKFNYAARNGRLELLSDLSLDPEVNLNWKDSNGGNPFYYACTNGHVDIVRFLLDFDQGRIDCNQKEKSGSSPFFSACSKGHEAVVELLLGDKRIALNKANRNEMSPLWIACLSGHVGVVKRILASGRYIDLLRKDRLHRMTALEIATQAQRDEITSLIAEYERRPQKVRRELRRELYEPRAGELFALVVFASDGYLKVRRREGDPENTKRQDAQRFFALAARLPMDLQMELCNRVFELEASIIKRVHSEQGFKKFAKEF